MSWAEEDWTVGLSGRVLQKVKELQVQQDRLSRENKQRQLQLDNSQDALNKQILKNDDVRREQQALQRELKGAQEEAQAKACTSERLAVELQTKQAQVCSLQGQLDAARTHTQGLTLEVKRLEAELEKMQNSSSEASLFSTPCWNMTSPWEHNVGRQDDRPSQRGEANSRALHVRQQLQFSNTPTGSLPRHGNRSTPHQRRSSDQSEAFSTPTAAFPWEREDSGPNNRGRCHPPTPQTPSTDVPGRGQLEQRDRGRTEDLSKETETCLSELRGRVCALESELCAEAERLRASQEQLGRSQKELSAAEHSLQKSRDQLSLAHTCTAQESDRVSGAEQKLRKMQEELKCQRQNAESNRLQHQRRTKELEKQHQKDLSELQKERQFLERQHQQEVTKLSQELQQARVLHNTLQAQAEKLSLQKQGLDREVETLREKLKWTEGQLHESQKKDAQTQAKLMELQREAQGMAASLEQSTRRERSLEEEGKRVTQERDDALCLLKELRDQNVAQAPVVPIMQLCSLGQSFSSNPCSSPEPRPSDPGKKLSFERRCEPGRDQGRGGQTALKYPTDREPGEGSDSEHISTLDAPDSERSHRHAKQEDDTSGCDSSWTPTQKCNVTDSEPLLPLQSAAPVVCILPEQEVVTALRKENSELQSELREAREELQKRLEDLETQRRAEAEARTRLKQLSRKRAGREAEMEEQERGRKAELERERCETERLRNSLASLQAQVSRDEEEARDEKVREEHKLMELNIQLKTQLSEMKFQLALEREEREEEEEKKKKKRGITHVAGVELSVRLAELETELEELKRCGKKAPPADMNLSEANSPLTYLTLHNDDKHNTNIAGLDNNQPLSSPDQHRLLCQTTNQLNAAVSQTTGKLIMEEEQNSEVLEHLLLPNVGPNVVQSQVEPISPDLEDATAEKQNLSGHDGPPCPEVPTPSDLAVEVERLQEKNAQEAWRAEWCQAKLQALQTQVTRQTQQLTMAFDRQSQHITGLLAELQEKESALLSQGEELQRCRTELVVLTARVVPPRQRQQGREEEMVVVRTVNESSEPQLYHSQLPSDLSSTATSPTESLSKDLRQSDPSEAANGNQGVVCDQKSGDEAPPSAVLRATGNTDETLSDCCFAHDKNTLHHGRLPQVPSKLDGGDVDSTTIAEPCNAMFMSLQAKEERECSAVVPARWNVEEVSGDKGVDVDGEGAELESDMKEDSQAKVGQLEKQVVALQAELRALSEEKQRQAEELVLWRLASAPAPEEDQKLSCTFNESQLQDQGLGLEKAQNQRPNQHQMPNGSFTLPEAPAGAVEVKGQVTTLGVEEPEVTQDMFLGRGTLMVIREDQLILSCSSNKLQSCMLSSRVQNSDLGEPKSVLVSKKTSAPQDNIQNTNALIDEGSDKENVDGNYSEVAITKSPRPERQHPGAFQRAAHESSQRHLTEDPCVPLEPAHTKVSEQSKEELTASATLSKEGETTLPHEVMTSAGGCRELSTKSTATQTDDAPRLASVSARPQHDHVCTQTVEEDEAKELSGSPLVSLDSSHVPTGDRLLFSGSFPIPSDPVRLAERIRRNRSQLSAAYDDTEYEPYGLPEVVMKGFADIPSGPACPYIVRRGLLGTPAVPLPQKDTPPREETD